MLRNRSEVRVSDGCKLPQVKTGSERVSEEFEKSF